METAFIIDNDNTQNVTNRLFTWLLAAIFAALITVFLIALMHVLIAGPKVEPLNIIERKMVDVVLVEAVIDNRKTIDKPIKDEPLIEPVIPKLIDVPSLPGDSEFTFATYTPPQAGGNKNIVLAPSNLPVARMMMAPEYPESAARKRIEGYVNVRFDITKTGATTNVTVIDAMPEGVFEKAAINAVKRWKYTPTMQEGEAVEFYGMAKRVVFEME